MPAPGRIALRIEGDTPCPGCGYNLRGLRLDARCPECGRPTADTFSRPLAGSDGFVAGEMLGIAGRWTLLAVLAGALALVQRQVPGELGPVPTYAVAAGILLVAGYRTGRRFLTLAAVARRYALGAHVRPAWGAFRLLVPAAAGLAAVGVVVAADRGGVASRAALGAVAVLTAAIGFVAGRAATGLLGDAASRATVGGGGWVLGAAGLVVVAGVAVPLAGVPIGVRVGVRAGVVGLGLLVWFGGWRRYEEALRVGSGPVTGL